jgi:hypothetical protein
VHSSCGAGGKSGSHFTHNWFLLKTILNHHLNILSIIQKNLPLFNTFAAAIFAPKTQKEDAALRFNRNTAPYSTGNSIF